uniref:Retinol binding protein 3 n=1 Tax=Paramormyrops kingsleyae TaxID=1676925 RepID=A0A3B3T5S4_9TELE
MILTLALLVIVGSVCLVHSSYPPTLVMDMAKILAQNYCYPERLEGIIEAIEAARSNTDILNIPDPNAVAMALSAGMASTIGDSRLLITYEPDFIPKATPVLSSVPPEYLISIIKKSVQVEVLENNIGYFRIDHIIGEDIAEKIGPLLVENIWNKVLLTSAMILDLRHTASGELSGVPYIVSYFSNAEPPTCISTVYDRPSNTTVEFRSLPELLGKRYGVSKDLIILTSKNTRGVAEDVAYAMKNMKRATIVGERTAGGSLKIEKLRVGETGFYFTMPTASVRSPITGESWEVKGVTPCIEVDAGDALETAVKIINLRSTIPVIVQEASVLVAEKYAFTQIAEDVSQKLLDLLENGTYSMINSETELEARLSADLKELSGDKFILFIFLMVRASFQTDILENNVGLLRFDMFGDFEQVAPIAKIIVENVWNKVVNTTALVIDLRNNVGGYTSTISGFCSYFFDGNKQILLDTLYNRPSETLKEMWTLSRLTGERYGEKKGLIILTSAATMGAAEEFVYIMKKLGRATVIGEVTRGGCHPPETFRVADSDVYLSVPVTRSDALQDHGWEGVGISPHIPASADAALDTAKELLNEHFGGQK